jgi:uncharacterized DUF497 family protein
MEFEWDDAKNTLNMHKHNLSFHEAQTAFLDKRRIIFPDLKHSSDEERYFCIGKTVNGGIATVRFTKRNGRIRIIGAGYWREGRNLYDKN